MAARSRTAFILLWILQIAAGCAVTNKDSSPQIIQPDYQRWSQIQVGMAEKDVIALLGKPLSGGADCPESITNYSVTYGILQFESDRFPSPYEFSIMYDCKNHTVTSKGDPFEGKFSPDGKPTIPLLINPPDGQKFSHYPRFVDFRWTPSSGVYPMSYEVQLNSDPEKGWTSPSVLTWKSDDPLLVWSWVGAQAGVWRVRAINKLGTSAWSEQRTFAFSR